MSALGGEVANLFGDLGRLTRGQKKGSVFPGSTTNRERAPTDAGQRKEPRIVQKRAFLSTALGELTPLHRSPCGGTN